MVYYNNPMGTIMDTLEFPTMIDSTPTKPKFVCTKCNAPCVENKCKCGTYSVYSVRRARRNIKGR